MSRPGSTARVPVRSYRDGKLSSREDLLTTEEPLELRVATFGAPSVPLTVTMRTPGGDFELAAGFLYSEGILESHEQIHRIAYCADVARTEQQYNVVTVELRPDCRPRMPDEERRFAMTAACGVCGKSSIESLKGRDLLPLTDERKVSADTLLSLPAALRDAQSLFHKTGGLHAAALFDGDDRLLTLREDVGRHNAVDKIVGERFLAGKLPLRDHLLLVSGRPGFEIVQKAVAAGIPVLAGVSAPSSLAVETAREFGMTLIGFLREDRFNVYTAPERVVMSD